MQSFRMVNDLPGKISFNRGLDLMDIGQDRLDAARCEPIVRAHAARLRDLAIGDRVHHEVVPVLGSRVGPVAFAGLVRVFFLPGELAVVGFGARFLRNDPALLHGKYLIMKGTAKMGGNGFKVIGDDSNFHGSSLVGLILSDVPGVQVEDRYDRPERMTRKSQSRKPATAATMNQVEASGLSREVSSSEPVSETAACGAYGSTWMDSWKPV